MDVLAEMKHHTAPRGPKMARAGEGGERDTVCGRDPGEPPPQPELFQLLEEEPGVSQPAPLSEVAGWQERIQRHTVEHADAICPFVQIHDAHAADGRTAGALLQVIGVHQISEDIIQPRLADRDLRHPQVAEQLVKVPTVLSFPSLQQTAEHIVNIPVQRGFTHLWVQIMPDDRS